MLIAFFGNDFLPEMLNTIDLKKTFTALRRGTIRPDNTKDHSLQHLKVSSMLRRFSSI